MDPSPIGWRAVVTNKAVWIAVREILMHIRPVERGESWYCSENEIRSFIDLAQDPDT